MKMSTLLVPVALLLSANAAQAQDSAACPQLPADAELTWEHKGTGGADFCRALRSDGSEAFIVYIANDSPFKPKRGNRDVEGVVDGRDVYWYRAEIGSKPDVKALETLIELGNGQVAHVWLQSRSDVERVLGVTRDLRFSNRREVPGGQ